MTAVLAWCWAHLAVVFAGWVVLSLLAGPVVGMWLRSRDRAGP